MLFSDRLMKCENCPLLTKLFRVKKVGHFLTFSKVVGIKPLYPNWSPGLAYFNILIIWRTSLPIGIHIEPFNIEIKGVH